MRREVDNMRDTNNIIIEIEFTDYVTTLNCTKNELVSAIRRIRQDAQALRNRLALG